MMLPICSAVLLLATQSWSITLDITVQDPIALKSYSFETNNKHISENSSQLHNSLLTTQKFHRRSYIKDDLRFSEQKVAIDGQLITRTIPLINNIPVEGADGISNLHQLMNQFNYTHFQLPKATFRLSAAECMEKALASNPNSTISNPYVEKINGAYEQIWLMHFGELRPVYKVRLPTLSVFELKDTYVDAENGEILRIDDAAQFDSAIAHVFVYSPKSPKLDQSELRQVTLKDLGEVKENGFLNGQYVSVKNCCQYFSCPEEGECSEVTKRCALKSHRNAQQTRELIELPTATLGLDPLIDLPETIFVDSVRCTYLPFAKASFRKSDRKTLGFFDQPIDEPGIESEMDRFSEIQAYFSVMSFFYYIRSLINNTFCLRPQAMSCNSDGSPVLDDHGLPKNPYRVFVNQVIPDMKLEETKQSDYDSFLAQAMAGKGSKDNPIKLDHFIRLGNAAFIPALSTLKTPPRADEILSDLIKPYDHNVFFQGGRDFAYDGHVVFHEFMHAITTTLINKINSLGLDEWGIHSEPGGLNEAWADYFAAAFTNNPALGEYASIRGGYGEVALRHVDNSASCPNDVIGEIHNDGLIWSGALWEIRAFVNKNFGETGAFEFDRAVLASLAQATTTEDYKTQGAKLLDNIKARQGLSDDVYSFAKEVLKRRGILDCFRAATLTTVDQKNTVRSRTKNLLFVPSKNQIGLKNYAVSAEQLEIGIPAGAKSMTISWRQFLGGTGALLGTEATPDSTKNIEPLQVISSLDVPITWKFQNAYAIATRNDEPIDAPVLKAHYVNGYWQFSMPLNFERCDQRTIYISLLSKDFKYVLENVSVNFDVDKSMDLSDCHFNGNQRGSTHVAIPPGCSSTDTREISFMMTLLVLALLRRKKLLRKT